MILSTYDRDWHGKGNVVQHNTIEVIHMMFGEKQRLSMNEGIGVGNDKKSNQKPEGRGSHHRSLLVDMVKVEVEGTISCHAMSSDPFIIHDKSNVRINSNIVSSCSRVVSFAYSSTLKAQVIENTHKPIAKVVLECTL